MTWEEFIRSNMWEERNSVLPEWILLRRDISFLPRGSIVLSFPLWDEEKLREQTDLIERGELMYYPNLQCYLNVKTTHHHIDYCTQRIFLIPNLCSLVWGHNYRILTPERYDFLQVDEKYLCHQDRAFPLETYIHCFQLHNELELGLVEGLPKKDAMLHALGLNEFPMPYITTWYTPKEDSNATNTQ